MIHRAVGGIGLLMLFSAALAQGQPAPAVEATLQMRELFKPASSVLWSPAGQAAWDALRMYHHVNKIQLEPASETGDALDRFVWDQAATLPPDTLIFGGEYTNAFADLIRSTLLKKIGKQAADMIDPAPELGPTGRIIDGRREVRLKSAIIVSALVARPKFPSRFQEDSKPRAFTSSLKTTSLAYGFGADGGFAAQMGDAVTVLRDDLQGSLVVELMLYTGSPDDRQRMILAMDPRISTVEKGIAFIKEARSNPLPAKKEVEANGRRWSYVNTLSSVDQFWMPELKASVLCDYGDLNGHTYLHENRGDDWLHTWWQIKAAQQLLSIKFDHTGALVQAVFKIQPDFTSMGGEAHEKTTALKPDVPLPLYPKRLLFNQPFMVSLWRVGSDLPYLACWVDGADMLRSR